MKGRIVFKRVKRSEKNKCVCCTDGWHIYTRFVDWDDGTIGTLPMHLYGDEYEGATVELVVKVVNPDEV